MDVTTPGIVTLSLAVGVTVPLAVHAAVIVTVALSLAVDVIGPLGVDGAIILAGSITLSLAADVPVEDVTTRPTM